jgi:FtsP/CotA-like multicopper oxidase with cupredoxin domain
MNRSFWALCFSAVAICCVLAFGPTASAQATEAFDPSRRSVLREPVTLSSKDGLLEVELTAHQGEVTLDTVAKPVQNFLVFAFKLVHGTASNGKLQGDNLYPAPTLKVDPGERLVIRLGNGLTGLTIEDFFDPKYIKKGEEVPLYPEQLTSAPLNLHVHGVHVSPKGNSDNVMLHIAPGMANTYVYDIPKNMPQGAYWYHSHLHTVTTAQTYAGLAGLLAIGRTDGNIPLVTANRIPIRNMILQYNYVSDRKGGLAQLNSPSWPMWVSTLKGPNGSELADGKYRPSLAPTNFAQSKIGERAWTVWYSGPLSIQNYRGLFQFIPSNLQQFTPNDGKAENSVAADPSLPDYLRDVQFTVNGQFQPTIKSKPGQTEIWVLANVSDMAYMNVQLTETATGRHPQIAIVGQDGNPYPAVHYPVTENGTRLLIPPASRFAIAVTMPAKGDLILEMPPRGGGAKTIIAPGVLYTNNGSDTPPGVLGSLSVLPSAVSYVDGFFVFPTQVLARATPEGGKGRTTVFKEGQALNAYDSFVDVSEVEPDVKRELLISGGFLNDLASPSDPKAFVYAFEGTGFPNVPLIQPRLGSVEEWIFVNENNDEHPIHVHVNDFQTVEYDDPTVGLKTGIEMWGEDNANVPAPTLGPGESVIERGRLSIRTKFEDYTGIFVMHCHRLNHEDNGLMALVNVIPAVSTYAVVIPGAAAKSAEVKIYDAAGDRLMGTVTPFPGHEGIPTVAMGDVDADNVLDLVVGAGKDHAPEVVVYSGKGEKGKAPFTTELARFMAFAPDARGGVSVASAQIDGKVADNIIVGSGAGIPDEVRIYALSATRGAAPDLFASFKPYDNDHSGVTVSAGFVDFASGRSSIVTAAGPGGPGTVKVFNFSLMKPVKAQDQQSGPPQPATTASFAPFGEAYRGGVSLATGWLAGSLGGAERIVVGQLGDGGKVKVFSSGSRLDGGPPMYLHSAMAHQHIEFAEIASFDPFDGDGGVSVATTSTTTGADLLVGGVSTSDKTARVVKYQLVRPDDRATMLDARKLSEVTSVAGSAPLGLGGD